MFYIIRLFFLLFSFFCFSQDISIKGRVVDKETSDPLVFASILLKEKKIGTVSDTLGYFKLDSELINPLDSITIEYLGYRPKSIALKDTLVLSVVKLEPNSMVMDEIIVTDYHPTHFIKQALMSVDENYDLDPYYLISYFENNLYENGLSLAGSKTVFKTYFDEHPDYINNQPKQEHQLLLYHEKKDVNDLKFMKKNIMKKIKKEQIDSKADATDGNDKFLLRLTPLYVPIFNKALPFLNETYFKHFRYKLTEKCTSRNLIVIDFETKNSFSYSYMKFKGKGRIYIDCENFAIIKLEINMRMVPGFLIKTYLFMAFHKVRINKTHIIGSIEYEKKNAYWYPKSVTLNAESKAKKVKWFSKNEKGFFEFSSSLLVNQVSTKNVNKVPKEKEFSFRKINIHNDMNIQWKDITRVKYELYDK